MHNIPFSRSNSSLILIALFGSALSLSIFAQDTLTPIPVVRGSEGSSPLEGKTVTVEGTVTGDFRGKKQLSGFFIQDPRGDGNDATPDGIFVYVNSNSPAAGVAVKVGDSVRVSGEVGEHDSQTQIGSVTKIDDLGPTTPIAATPVTLPLPAGVNFKRYEEMLVSFSQPLTVTDNYELGRYGDLTLALGGRIFGMGNQMTTAKPADAEANSFLLDDGSNSQNPNPIPYLDAQGTRRTGSTVSGLVGIMSFGHDKHRLQPTVAPVFKDSNPRPAGVPNVGGNLKIGAANLHNYWTTFKDSEHPDARGATNAVGFARQSAKIVAELHGLGADAFGFMELENNGDKTINDLVTRLNDSYKGTMYVAVPIPTTGLGSDAIRVGMIYKPSRLTPIGAPHSATDAIFDRRPLAQTFLDKQTGGIFTLVVNHWKSKGSCPDSGDVDTGEGCWNEKRTHQAQAVVRFVDRLKKFTGDDDVLVIGDLNAYVNEKPLRTMRAAGFKHINLRLPEKDRYSFGYAGQFGSLDHALATPSMDKQITGFDEWHINSDEPSFLDFAIAGPKSDTSPYRASDHDPFLLGLNLTPTPVAKPTPKPAVRARKPRVVMLP